MKKTIKNLIDKLFEQLGYVSAKLDMDKLYFDISTNGKIEKQLDLPIEVIDELIKKTLKKFIVENRFNNKQRVYLQYTIRLDKNEISKDTYITIKDHILNYLNNRLVNNGKEAYKSDYGKISDTVTKSIIRYVKIL